MDKNNFIVDRLTEARESRGLKQVALSQLVGLTRQSISAYEKGINKPTVEILEKISALLNFPVSFFISDRCQKNNNTIFFRSLASTTKTERQISAHRIQWIEDILDYLVNYVDLVPSQIPNYDLGSKPGVVPDCEIEKIADQVRTDWGLGFSPISNVAQLLENNGAILSLQVLPSASLDAFSKVSSHGIPVIVYGSNKKSGVRSRFDLAHELGHLVLHRSINKINLEKELLATIERQAHRFASSFLLPEKSFTADLSYPSLNNFRLLKGKWLVSIAAMIKRCYDLKIINDSKNVYFNIQKSKFGWNTREPLDDVIQIERPVLLSRAFKLLIDERVKTKEEILNDLPFAEEEIIHLAGLDPDFFVEPDKITPKLKLVENNRDRIC